MRIRSKPFLAAALTVLALGAGLAAATPAQAKPKDYPYAQADGVNCNEVVGNRSATQSQSGTLRKVNYVYTVRFINHRSSATNYACGAAAPYGSFPVNMPKGGKISMTVKFSATGAVITSCTGGTSGVSYTGGITGRAVTAKLSTTKSNVTYAASGVGFSSVCAKFTAATSTQYVYSSAKKGGTSSSFSKFFC